jgi:hypothetical protein
MPFFSTLRRNKNSAGSQPRRRRSTYQDVSVAQLFPPTHLASWADSRFVRTRSGSSLVIVPRSRRSFSPSRTSRSDGGYHHRRLDNVYAESPETSISASSPSRQQRARECQFEHYPIPRISRLNWVSIRSSTQRVHGRNSLVAT